jgi:hypothetical protein
MLLLYSLKSTTRLQYICKFIFEEILGTSYSITTDEENFKLYTGSKINYSDSIINDTFQIKPHALLFETIIQPQAIKIFHAKDKLIFFASDNEDYPFDVFSATFYLLTRYEEYLLHKEDMYGRFAHENSLAFKENFLYLPLVNLWLEDFKHELLQRFPDLVFKPKSFSFTPTYDIDIAWSYKEKGLIKNIGGFIKAPTLERVAVLLTGNKDPYDSYEFMDDLHGKYNLKPLYFFLVANKNGLYDKNILPSNTAMQELIKQHASNHKIGLHPSWQSYNHDGILKEEKNILENISERTILISRQHYIKLNLPETYQSLLKTGITDDYSMGYGSINGFRASTASPFYWYDLSAEKSTSLRIHPFCFMDANCFYEQKLTVEESFIELMNFYQVCQEAHAPLVTIFHNNFLGTGKMYEGWRELYFQFISQLQQ